MSNTRYLFPSAEPELYPARLLYLTQARYDQDWHSTPHFHPFVEILFVTSGKGQFMINDQVYQLKRGNIVIINPNMEHTEMSTPNDPLEYIILGIDNVSFEQLSQQKENLTLPVFDFSMQYEKAKYYLYELEKELKERKADYQLAAESILTLFMIFLVRSTELIQVTPPPSTISSSSMSKECIFVKQYIDSNFALDISLDELSKKTYISKFHLSHTFKKYTGMSPINYLIERRLLEAKALLTTTAMTITSIARFVGFSSPAYFTKQFKHCEHVTPAQFRKQMLQLHKH